MSVYTLAVVSCSEAFISLLWIQFIVQGKRKVTVKGQTV